jgi:uncharacterized protein YndB with AHSA1/START domain
MKSDIKITGRRLQITRVFDAPRAAVFAWWSSAENLQQWSGCKESTRCEVQMDFRTGGSFKQTMHIAGHGAFTITGTYDEIIAPEKIVYHVNLGQAFTSVVIEFFDEGNRTKVLLTQDGFPDETMPKIVSQGTSESLDKLDTLLPHEALAHNS